jgi:hypothetical protein
MRTFAVLLLAIAILLVNTTHAALNPMHKRSDSLSEEHVITNKPESRRQEIRSIKKKRQLQLPGSGQLNILPQNGDIIKLFNTDYYIGSPNPNDRSSNVHRGV